MGPSAGRHADGSVRRRRAHRRCRPCGGTSACRRTRSCSGTGTWSRIDCSRSATARTSTVSTRQLALFEPPIDPALLVRARAAGARHRCGDRRPERTAAALSLCGAARAGRSSCARRSARWAVHCCPRWRRMPSGSRSCDRSRDRDARGDPRGSQGADRARPTGAGWAPRERRVARRRSDVLASRREEQRAREGSMALGFIAAAHEARTAQRGARRRAGLVPELDGGGWPSSRR